ncbi:DUF2332 domain-containing protein [Cytobacillus sp. Hz8]|uniref:DUF2332 domain-containing protein n=1 Tax=Cytobacillus sp. Hz8 TaxID=3347168 RepID=UPI0035E1264D
MLKELPLSERFIRFAQYECHDSSELYEFLSRKIAKDQDLLEICKTAKKGQPIPNLFFGAVHYLLLKYQNHRLKDYYPSIVTETKPFTESFKPFKEFCLLNMAEIVRILQTKIVQTNEVRRCAYLYPVFSLIYEKTNKPLALLEIGTSSGLLLLWDQYSYSYNEKDIVGNPDANFVITSKNIGPDPLPVQPTSPPVSARIGFDLNPINLKDSEAYLWLKALIWPEHQERLSMFEKAAEIVTNHPIHLIHGDGIVLLDDYIHKIPKEQIPVIFHTHVANQLAPETKNLLLNKINSIGKGRDVFHLYNNIRDRYLHLEAYLDGTEYKQIIADTDGHGRWFKWYPNGLNL